MSISKQEVIEKPKKFSAIFVSHHPAIEFFLDQWLQSGNTIFAVICSDHRIKDAYKLLPEKILYAAKEQLYAELAITEQNRPDYIFSIINHHILKPHILAIPTRGAINYHEGPLEGHVQYRGVYASSWMIHNQEKEFCITWHWLEEEVDSGEVLTHYEKRIIAITEEETAQSLSAKGFESAKKSFLELVKNLPLNKPQRHASGSTDIKFHTRSDKIPNNQRNGIIDFTAKSADILRIHRALTLSKVEANYLGTTKLILVDKKQKIHCLFPQTLEIGKDTSSSQKAGTILEITADYLVVATQDRPIKISMMTDHLLQPITDVKDYFNQLEIMGLLKNPLLSKDVTEFYQNERKWMPLLKNSQVTCFGFKLNSASMLPKEEYISSEEISIASNEFKINELTILSLVAFYCLRAEPISKISFGYWHTRFTDLQNALFFPFLPINLSCENDLSFSGCMQMVEEYLKINSYSVYSSDVIVRYPDLWRLRLPFPINVIFSEQDSTAENLWITKHSMLLWQFNLVKKTFSVKSNLAVIDESERRHFIEFFHRVLIQQLRFLSKNLTKELMLNLLFNNTLNVKPHLENFTANVLTVKTRGMAMVNESYSYSYDSLFQDVARLSMNFSAAVSINDSKPILIYMPLSKEWLISVCAIIKLGYAYVPLAVQNSQEIRNNYVQYLAKIINTIKPLLILVDNVENKAYLQQVLSKAQLDETIKLISLDEFNSHNLDNYSNDLNSIIDVEHITKTQLAYILFTSGTTSDAKGVKVSLKSLVYATQARMEYYKSRNCEPSTILTLTNEAFDATTGMVWWALFSAATLVTFDKTVSDQNKSVFNLLVKNKVSHFIATPRQYKQFIHYIRAYKGPDLKVVILGGESFGMELVTQHMTLLPGAHLFAEYGVTEATICSSIVHIYNAVEKKLLIRGTQPPIGLPLTADIRYSILDSVKRSTLPGIKGKLVISGPIVAEGYVEQNNNTAFTSPVRSFVTADVVYFDLYENQFVFDSRAGLEGKKNGIRFDEQFILDTVKRKNTFSDYHLISSPDLQSLLLLTPKAQPLNYSRVTQEIIEVLKNNLPLGMMPLVYVSRNMESTTNGKIDIKSIKNLMMSQLGDYYDQLLNFWSDFCNNHLDLNLTTPEVKNYLENNDSISALGIVSQLVVYAKEKFSQKFKLNESYAMFIVCNDSLTAQAKLWESLSTRPAVLITGVTGFVGIYLLVELYGSNCDIYALVRTQQNSSLETVKTKLIKTLRDLKIDDAIVNSMLNDMSTSLNTNHRIKLIEGDIAEPKWGMGSHVLDRFEQLTFDAIYHCAANVNHLLKVEQLYPDNVKSVETLINDIAPICGYPKIIYISTLSTQLHASNTQLPGYLESKIEAEKYINKMRTTLSELDIQIIRPAWVIGTKAHSTVLDPTNDHFTCLIKTFFELKQVPRLEIAGKDSEVLIDFVPVNILVEVITHTKHNKNCDLDVAYSLRWATFFELFKYLMPDKFCRLVNKSNWIKDLNAYFTRNNSKVALAKFINHYQDGAAGLLDSLQNQSHDSSGDYDYSINKLLFDYNEVALVCLMNLIANTLEINKSFTIPSFSLPSYAKASSIYGPRRKIVDKSLGYSTTSDFFSDPDLVNLKKAIHSKNFILFQQAIENLIEINIHLNDLDRNPLAIAVKCENWLFTAYLLYKKALKSDVIDELINHMTEKDKKKFQKLFNLKWSPEDNNSNQSLIAAVISNNLFQLFRNIEQGCEINAFDQEGCTAIYYAISCERVEMLKLLLELGGNALEVSNINHNVCSATSLLNDLPKVHPKIIKILSEFNNNTLNLSFKE